MTIRIEDEDNFPHNLKLKNERFKPFWDGAAMLRGLKKGYIVVPIPKGITAKEAMHKVHTIFQRDPIWRVVTKVRDGELHMRKERVKI
jgi:hypothetical protein